MDTVVASRALIGDTLAFHLLFVMFGVGLPLIISAVEGYGVFKKKPGAIKLAHQWSRALVVLFIAGAISGTIVSMQFNLFWPTFTILAGKVVGISFALEGFAFLIEALFLSVYMLSWKRFSAKAHWLVGLPVVLGSLTSAFFITTVNSWMNTPRGFELNAAGEPINIDTKAAVFNPATATETTHSILSYILATAAVLLAIYAWIAWRHKLAAAAKRSLHQILVGLAGMVLVASIMVGLAGDQAGRMLAKHEPTKLAAIEGLQQTQTNAPLLIGGVVKDGQIEHAIKIPGLLSFLATGNFNGRVSGLNEVPPADRPPPSVHYFFDGMVFIGALLVIVPAAFLAAKKWRPKRAFTKPFMVTFVICGVLAVIAVELGWMVTEFGRQPYIIQGVMRVSQAATKDPSVIRIGEMFPILYLLLLGFTIFALRKVFKPATNLP